MTDQDTGFRINFWTGYRGKLLLTCAAVTVVTLSCVFIYLDKRQEALYRESIHNQARALFQQVVLTRQWISEHGGVFVEKLPWEAPNPFLKERSVTATTGKKYLKKNPATVTRELSEYSRKQGTYWFHMTSLLPINPDNFPDEFEARSLRSFETSDMAEAWGILTVDGHKHFRYIAPLFVEQSCLECHAQQGYRVGDVRGGISVTIPMEKFYKSLKRERLMMAGFVMSIALMLMGGLYLALNRVIVSPVRTLRDFALTWSEKADEIPAPSNGEAKPDCLAAPLFKGADELHDLYRVLCQLRSRVTSNQRDMQDRISEATAELARVNQQLIEARDRHKNASEQKSRFIAGLSHELRTPLTSIKGAAGFISERLRNRHFIAEEAEQELSPFLDIISRNINRFVKLVEDTLDMEKIEAGQLELTLSQVDMAEVLQEAAREFAPLAAENDIMIKTSVEGSVVSLMDPDRIFQVLSNLIVNALRHSPRGSTLGIYAREAEGEILVSVSDEGPGIHGDEATRVFELFHKGSKDGTGLGLTIAKSIVEKHGGRIWVEGLSPRGSKFVFTLKRAEAGDE